MYNERLPDLSRQITMKPFSVMCTECAVESAGALIALNQLSGVDLTVQNYAIIYGGNLIGNYVYCMTMGY